jgi:hypothetical protein
MKKSKVFLNNFGSKEFKGVISIPYFEKLLLK